MGKWKSLALTKKEDVEIDVRGGDNDSFLSQANIQQCLIGKVLL